MDFYNTLVAAGLLPKGTPEPDGKFHRCPTEDKPKKKNGYYKLSFNGEIGWYGDFGSSHGTTEWRADEKQIAIMPRRDAADLAARRMEERKIVFRAVHAMRDYWHTLPPMSSIHPYLAAKNLSVQGCDQLRVDRGGAGMRAAYKALGIDYYLTGDLLVMPMYRGDALISVQVIDEGGKKLYWKDAPTKGASLLLARRGSTITILAEGYATALALYQSIPNASVIVSFSADNMVYIAEQIKPVGMWVVAADNDHATAKRNMARTGIATNPGIEKGQKAAGILGVKAVWPERIDGSDWCDALYEWQSPIRIRMAVLKAVGKSSKASYA